MRPKNNVRYDGRRGGSFSVHVSNIFKSEVIHLSTISLPTIETLLIETVSNSSQYLISSNHRNSIN